MNNTDLNAAIIALRKDGIGPREIARRMKVTPGLVAGVLDRAGLTVTGRTGGASDDLKRRVLKDLRNGPSCAAVAAKWNLPRTTVQSWSYKASGVTS